MKKWMGKLIFKYAHYFRLKFYNILSTENFTGIPHKIQPILILGNGRIEFEKNVTFGYFPSPFFFNGYAHIEARGNNAFVRFGDDTHINNNFVAIAEHTSIVIGKRCFIGTNVEITDSDFHGLRVADRRISDPEKARPVIIGNDVFIGSNVKILKGVTIGAGSIVANGSIVVSNAPPLVIIGGNPAKVLKGIES